MAVVLPASDEPPVSVDRLPTLTEVVELRPAGAPTAVDAQALIEQVLAELAPRIDRLFEARLREALAPALARAADGLIRDTRAELSATLHDLVQEAVARVLQERRDR